MNAGFTCPNIDTGSGKGGCIFCNELGFSRFAGETIPLEQRIEIGMADARKKRKAAKFMAYFQNATGTNAPCERLKAAYDVIKGFSEIVALSVSTRPDCVDDRKLDLIAGYTEDYDVWIEYGLQTIRNRTLELINRGHTFEQSVEAIERTAERGIKVGVHVILGLPGESRADMIATAQKISEMPVTGIKLHVLHVLKDTELEKLYRKNAVSLLNRDEYVSLVCDFLENTRADRVILRLVSDAKNEFLIAPTWINDKLYVINQIKSTFASRGTRQGIFAHRV